jgi:hypothetical protein
MPSRRRPLEERHSLCQPPAADSVPAPPPRRRRQQLVQLSRPTRDSTAAVSTAASTSVSATGGVVLGEGVCCAVDEHLGQVEVGVGGAGHFDGSAEDGGRL